MASGTEGPAAAFTLSLDGFCAYAESLHGLLGSLDLVERSLASLLDASGDLPVGAGDTAALGRWCLDEEALSRHGPNAVARLLLLNRVAGGKCPIALRDALLLRAPALLAEAPAPVARSLAGAAASAFDDGDEAAAWLRSLRADGASESCAAFAWAAGALLARRPDDAAVREEAWAAAATMAAGSNAMERRRCAQHVLPALVDDAEAMPRLSSFVCQLLGDAETSADPKPIIAALELAVAFHGKLSRHWRLAAPRDTADELGVRLVAAGLRIGRKEQQVGRKHARFLLESAFRSALADSTSTSCLVELGTTATEVKTTWTTFWLLYDSMEDFASHLLKACWTTSVDKLMVFFREAALRALARMDTVPFLV